MQNDFLSFSKNEFELLYQGFPSPIIKSVTTAEWETDPEKIDDDLPLELLHLLFTSHLLLGNPLELLTTLPKLNLGRALLSTLL